MKVTADAGSGNFCGAGQGLDDVPGVPEWIRIHRIYCMAVVAIIVATLFGAHWAGQPWAPEIGTMSSSPSVVLEAPLPAVS
jgi:hypothetical protein